jgi:hypothetical protein
MDVVGDVVGTWKAFDCREWQTVGRRLVEWNSDAETAEEYEPEFTRGSTSTAERAAMIAALVPAGWALSPQQFPWADSEAGAPVRKASEIAAAEAKKDEMAKAMMAAKSKGGDGGAEGGKPGAGKPGGKSSGGKNGKVDDEGDGDDEDSEDDDATGNGPDADDPAATNGG